MGYYVLKTKELGLPEPEVFFVEDEGDDRKFKDKIIRLESENEKLKEENKELRYIFDLGIE